MSCLAAQLPTVHNGVSSSHWSRLKGFATVAVFTAKVFGRNSSFPGDSDVLSDNADEAFVDNIVVAARSFQKKHRYRKPAKVSRSRYFPKEKNRCLLMPKVGRSDSSWASRSKNKTQTRGTKKFAKQGVSSKNAREQQRNVREKLLLLLLNELQRGKDQQERIPGNPLSVSRSADLRGANLAPMDSVPESFTTNAVPMAMVASSNIYNTRYTGDVIAQESCNNGMKDTAAGALSSENPANQLCPATISPQKTSLASDFNSGVLLQGERIVGGATANSPDRVRFEGSQEKFEMLDSKNIDLALVKAILENRFDVKTINGLYRPNTCFWSSVKYLEMMHHQQFLEGLVSIFRRKLLPANFERWMDYIESLVNVYWLTTRREHSPFEAKQELNSLQNPPSDPVDLMNRIPQNIDIGLLPIEKSSDFSLITDPKSRDVPRFKTLYFTGKEEVKEQSLPRRIYVRREREPCRWTISRHPDAEIPSQSFEYNLECVIWLSHGKGGKFKLHAVCPPPDSGDYEVPNNTAADPNNPRGTNKIDLVRVIYRINRVQRSPSTVANQRVPSLATIQKPE